MGSNLNDCQAYRTPHPSVRRREKEPDKFDWKLTDWRDYIVQFKNIASWNGWTEADKAQQ